MSDFTRLPKDVEPESYQIKITVDLNSKEFYGYLKIDINVVKPTKSIILNSHDLLINTATLNKNITGDVVYERDSQKIFLNFLDDLTLGKSCLEIEYCGKLNSVMKGFYYSSYTMDDGSIEHLAVTHFEPTNARYAFPCWDEPAFRAIFKISICCAKGLTAISNMPVASTSDNGDLVIHEFQATPSMSTYLVAFAIGNLEKKTSGTTISLYCRRNTPDNWASYALDVACRAIEFYEKWFGIKYVLPKLDLIAVPDFAGGAMENWGLVTFRERALLVNKSETSMTTKKKVALIISHELAHMWFGNLVTLEWWTDLWLKEGFAQWIEYFCVDHCFPTYDIWNKFIVNEYLSTVQLDSMLSTHPIEVVVKSPEEIAEIFDTISYAKGASVIRMLFNFLGEKEFREGLIHYLNQYQFKATKTEDLWNSLQECTDKPVKHIMNSWTKQSGYPVISVEMVRSSSDFIESITLKQERFLQSGESIYDSPIWNIPITIVNSKNPREEITSFVMSAREYTVDMSMFPERHQSVFINPSAIGIYRVIYRDGNNFKELKNCLLLSTWSASDKFSFIEDCFALTNAGKLPYGDVLDMLGFMKCEQSFTVWDLVNDNLLDIYNVLDESIHGTANVDGFVTNLAIDNYNRLGWSEKPDDSYNDVILRPLIIHLLAMVNHVEVVQKSKEIFKDFIDNQKPISANIRRVIYSIVGMHASEQEFHLLTERFAKCVTNNEQTDIINGVGQVPIVLQDRFINWVFSDCVRKQDKLIGLIAAANRSSKHRELIWTVIQREWSQLREMYAGQFLMGSLLKGCFNGFCSEDKANEIKLFFEQNESTSPRNVSQVIEKIESNSRRLGLHANEIHEYFVRGRF